MHGIVLSRIAAGLNPIGGAVAAPRWRRASLSHETIMDSPLPANPSLPGHAGTASARGRQLSGLLFAGGAFLLWGVSPIYWKALRELPALEIIVHRSLWSLLLGLLCCLRSAQRQELREALSSGRQMALLGVTALLISTNWLVYVWAVNVGRMLQTSLGYYITPLVNVLLGALVLGERLRRPQAVAVALAAGGVGLLTLSYGFFPWVSLVLALSFGLYGLMRKMAPVRALTGLTVETLLLGVPALIYVVHLEGSGRSAFLHRGIGTDLLLIGAGVLTALPLWLFTLGARRLTLASLGFIQYLAPSCIFLLGVFVYREPFSMAQLVTFGLIWSALGLYSWDALRAYRGAAIGARAATQSAAK
jgi:chloramphenicol-sensitive protein RarD